MVSGWTPIVLSVKDGERRAAYQSLCDSNSIHPEEGRRLIARTGLKTSDRFRLSRFGERFVSVGISLKDKRRRLGDPVVARGVKA